MTICKRPMGATLTKYDAVEMVLDCLGCPATLAYLRDLKASHDRLMAAVERQTDSMSFVCNRVDLHGFQERFEAELTEDRAALKAAEALR